MSDNQKILSLRFKSTFGEDALVAVEATIEEFLSRPYAIDAKVYATDESLDCHKLLKSEAAVIFEVYGSETGADDTKAKRCFHGVITRVEHLKTVTDSNDATSRYFGLRLRPSFWSLKYGADHRVFQNQSAIDAIQTIFSERGLANFEIKASGGKEVKEYRVQYGETHFDFVSRLLEEEGIGYYFTHADSSHTMVLFDKNADFATIPQKSLNYAEKYSGDVFIDSVYGFGKKSRIVPNAYKTVDFNYATPHAQLLGRGSGDGDGGEIYEYPGLFEKPAQGANLADARIEAIEWFGEKIFGESTAATLAAGNAFTLKKHPLRDYNQEYALSYVKHEIRSATGETPVDTSETLEFTYKNHFEGFAKTIPYRPSRETKKPRIYGSQTAFVTGSGTEVYGDDMGRIKIKFHWDLLGEDNETSSLWVRVSQSLSGSGWGASYVPRVGMEVVVSFIDGDPDRPIVTGCVYNQAFMPPYSAKTNPHYMTLKSKTFDDDSGFNELRFSDKSGEEEIYAHAQRDLNAVVEHSRIEKINTGDDTLTIGKGNKKIHQQGDGTTYLTLIDSGDRVTKLKNGNLVIDVSGTILIKAGDDITIKTPANITLDAGSNVIVKAGDDIKAKAGSNVNLKAGAEASFKAGADMSLKAGAGLSESAGSSFSMKAGTSLSAKTGTDMNLDAGTDFNLKAQANALLNAETGVIFKTLTLNVKADAMCNLQTAVMTIKTDAMTQIQSNAAIVVKAGAALMAEGGAMAAFKGAITKLG